MNVAETFRKLKPLYGKRIDALWLEWETGDVERKREIESLLALLAAKRLGATVGEERLVLDAPPPAVIGNGDFTIGEISYPSLPPYPFRVKRNELLRHVFILGPTGTGKSTLLLNLLTQVLEARVPFMVFDFKRNYRCLLATTNVDIVVFTVGRADAPLLTNALAPPHGIAFEEWAEALTDTIGTTYLLLQGARNVLKEALLQAHDEHGNAATLAHAHERISAQLDATKTGSRRYGWLESATRSLEEVAKGAFGRALNTAHLTIDSLLRRPVVFELQGLGDDQKRFFCLFFLQAVLLIRKNDTAAREQLQHLLVFDEGHNVFPKERPGEVSTPARLAREVREYGEAIIAATQQSDVSESLIANSGFKLILRCDYPRDVQFASQLLQVKPEFLPKLAMGTGIARLPTRWYTPLLFTFATQPIKNTHVPDTAVATRWHTHYHEPATTPALPETRHISTREEELLRDIATHPITIITKRYERLGWNAKTGNTVKDTLINKGLSTFEEVSTPTARVKILTLTPKGAVLLESRGVHVPHDRAGGIEHEYWKWKIAERLKRKGYAVTLERPIGGGRSVDLHAQREDEVLWIEVETGRSDVMANIEKCRSLPGRVLFVFTRSADCAAYEAHVPCAMTTASIDRL